MKKWKKRELYYIKKYFSEKKTEDIAIKLNRTYESIRKKAKRLGLDKIYCSKNKEEYEVFINSYFGIPVQNIINTYSLENQRIAEEYFKINKLRNEGRSIPEISTLLNISQSQISPHLYNKSSKALRCIRYLIKNKFLPFKIKNNKETKLILRLLASSFCDGHIHKRFLCYKYAGNKKDILNLYEEVKKVFPFLKLKIDFIKTKGNINGREIAGEVYVLIIQNSYFCRFLTCLGAPIGDKVLQSFVIPNFIYDLPYNLKAIFIGQIYSDEGSKPVHTDHSFYLAFKMNKRIELKNEHMSFLLEIKSLLNDFGIESGKVSWGRISSRKSGIKTGSGSFYISVKKENLKNFIKLPIFSEYKAKLIKQDISKKLYS